jgi:hypothetical protein
MQIRGKWDTGQVWIDERELSPERSQAVINHSPTGFAWGYGGSGPAQLALALLLELTSKEMALLWYQDVKWQIIAKLPQTDFTLDSEVVTTFIANEVNVELARQEPFQPAEGAGEGQTDLVITNTTAIDADFPYHRKELQAIFARAHTEDVEKGVRHEAW